MSCIVLVVVVIGVSEACCDACAVTFYCYLQLFLEIAGKVCLVLSYEL